MLKRERGAVRAAIKVQGAGSSFEARLAAALTEMLNMGGLYIKFAQLMLMNQAFSKTVPPQLRRQLFDRVRVDGNSFQGNFFTSYELAQLTARGVTLAAKPSYAGSFAAVFDGQYQGRQVIVKVIRPELRKQLKRDLRLIGLISKSVGVFKGDVQAALKDAYDTFRQSVMDETDYLKEVKLAEQLRQSYVSDPTIVIPNTYPSLSNQHFIVQDKLCGVWLSELLQMNLKGQAAADYVRLKTGSDIEYQLHYWGHKSLYDSLSGHTVHGDPHPGNVVLMSNNRVGLIDFGVLARPVKNRLALLEYIKEQIRGKEGDIDVPRLMLSIVRFHASSLYQALESLSTYYKRPILVDLYTFLQKEVEHSQDQIDESLVPSGQYSNMLSSSLNKGNRFGLLPKVDTPITQKSFITIWRTYDELGYMDLTFRVFRDTVSKIEIDNDVMTWRESPMPVERALEVIGEWLSLVSEKDPKLFNGLRRIVHNT